ncbi:hypothetical protein, partial [Trinickia soli]|uniref:hypothetical protein n=1 Tax=Trinickia soli TaxID=380675 RepID=UPI003FA35A53
IAPFSQELEPPPNPGRFKVVDKQGLIGHQLHLVRNNSPSSFVYHFHPCGFFVDVFLAEVRPNGLAAIQTLRTGLGRERVILNIHAAAIPRIRPLRVKRNVRRESRFDHGQCGQPVVNFVGLSAFPNLSGRSNRPLCSESIPRSDHRQTVR